jgi:type III restriction enzyme
VIAPGLTVKKRLAMLGLAAEGNYYEALNIVPSALLDKLRQGKVLVRNWHALAWESQEQIEKRKSVDKRGVKSDEAYTREVLGEMASAHNLLVINDEAHHAWRVNWDAEGKYLRARDLKDSAEEATVWIGGLDRLHRSRGILTCYDFSATTFTPSSKKSSEEALFGWIVSDFGLNDAIESGLVKTPRVVVRDDAVPDAKTYKSRLYHIHNDPEVKDDLNRKTIPEESLPALVLNAYHLLGYDWRRKRLGGRQLCVRLHSMSGNSTLDSRLNDSSIFLNLLVQPSYNVLRFGLNSVTPYNENARMQVDWEPSLRIPRIERQIIG